MRRKAIRRLVVEVGHEPVVAERVVGRARRHGVDEQLLDDVVAEVGGRDASGDRVAARSAVEGDDVGLPDEAGGLDRDELGVAGPDADAAQPAARQLLLAGEGVDGRGRERRPAAPPVDDEPRDVEGVLGEGELRLGRADEADRDADDRGGSRAAVGDGLEQVEERGRARCRWRRRRPRRGRPTARRRPRIAWCPRPLRAPGTRSSRSVQTTSLSRGRRARVMPDAIMCASVRIGAPCRSAVRAAVTRRGCTAMCSVRSTSPLACTIRTATTRASSGRWSRRASARIVANDRR